VAFGGTNKQMVPDEDVFTDQDLKVPQLRNLYKKSGFSDVASAQNKRGFGYRHDGAVDNLYSFLNSPEFDFGAQPQADEDRRDVEAFLVSFGTGTPPGVGHQVTFTGVSNPVGESRVDTLESEAALDRIDLVAKGRVAGLARGWHLASADSWRSDRLAEPLLTTAQLIALATGSGTELTITGVPEGSGLRMGVDRDRDTYFDRDELDAGSNPANPLSTPINVGVTPAGGQRFALEFVRPNPFRSGTEVVLSLGRAGPVDVAVFDLLGREVRSLARREWHPPGRVTLRWDGRRGDGSEAGVGVYFVRVRTEGGQWSRPVARIR
jgi:hypothetical protein